MPAYGNAPPPRCNEKPSNPRHCEARSDVNPFDIYFAKGLPFVEFHWMVLPRALAASIRVSLGRFDFPSGCRYHELRRFSRTRHFELSLRGA
jgi:hypothetical protein